MNNKVLYALWGGLYILCLLLGFIPSPSGGLKVMMVLFSLLFFLPGFSLLYRAVKARSKTALRRLRILSGASLLLTLLALIGSFLSVLASEAVGNFLHIILAIVSTPMLCSQYWVGSLFLWACLLMGTFLKKKC